MLHVAADVLRCCSDWCIAQWTRHLTMQTRGECLRRPARRILTHICAVIFDDKHANVNLVDNWGQAVKTANEYMRKRGLDAFQRSIQAFLDGKVQHHSFVCASNHTGVLIADNHLLDSLRLMASNKSKAVCYRQMLSAVKNSVLKSSVMTTFVPRRAPRAKVRTVYVTQNKPTSRLPFWQKSSRKAAPCSLTRTRTMRAR